jgi:large exoprotein involved in heme utilization and adhesion
VLVSGDGSPLFTGISSHAEGVLAGNGGSVLIHGQFLRFQNDGEVTAHSAGPGLGGSIEIRATDSLSLDQTSIRAQTALADGGDIHLSAGRLLNLQNSAVTTSVANGRGNGGNIFIDSPLPFMVFDGSRIEANAQRGRGGNITIRADQLIRTPDSVIQASSAESVSGTINITAPNVDVASSLVVLPETFLDASSRLREACATQGGRPTSSLVAGGQGGLPPDPGRPLSASPFGLSSERRADRVPNHAATLPLPPSTKGTLIAGNPVLGAPRMSCRG